MEDNSASQFADFESIRVGDEVELVRHISKTDIQRFADLTGDTNPLHLDDSFGSRTVFGSAVAHGMLSASLISTVIGTMLPGPGALWMSQTLEFLLPVRPGDTVTVRSKVANKVAARRLLELQTSIRNQRGIVVIEGKSMVQVLEEKQTQANQERTGLVALVTGASRGIGAAIARALAAHDIGVIVNFSKSEDQAAEVVEQIRSNGGSAMAIRADIGDPGQIDKLFEVACANMGPVDIMINNAWARPSIWPFLETKWEDFTTQWDYGVRSAYLCCQAALPHMVESKFGRIINIGTIAADATPPPNLAAYVTAKAALGALTRTMAVELGPSGITVNLIAAGMTQTSFIDDFGQKARLVTQMQTPLRQLARPEDIANMAAFLVGPSASHITGETMRVCGGVVML